MSTKEQEPLKGVPRSNSKRRLMKSALLVLGAGMLVQPAGGVFGMAQNPPKKDGSVQMDTKKDGGKKQTTKKKKKGGKKKEETPKKEGGI